MTTTLYLPCLSDDTLDSPHGQEKSEHSALVREAVENRMRDTKDRLRKSMRRGGAGSCQIVDGGNETTLELDLLKGRQK